MPRWVSASLTLQGPLLIPMFMSASILKEGRIKSSPGPGEAAAMHISPGQSCPGHLEPRGGSCDPLEPSHSPLVPRLPVQERDVGIPSHLGI